MHKITETLFLGSIPSYQDLERNKINVVISLNMQQDYDLLQGMTLPWYFCHIRRPVRCEPHVDIRGPAILTHRYIMQHLHFRILICCTHGQHRSAAVLLMHLMSIDDQEACQRLLKISDPYAVFGKWIGAPNR